MFHFWVIETNAGSRYVKGLTLEAAKEAVSQEKAVRYLTQVREITRVEFIAHVNAKEEGEITKASMTAFQHQDNRRREHVYGEG